MWNVSTEIEENGIDITMFGIDMGTLAKEWLFYNQLKTCKLLCGLKNFQVTNDFNN